MIRDALCSLMFKISFVKYYVNKLHVLWDKRFGIICKYELARSVNSYSTGTQHSFFVKTVFHEAWT